MKMFTEMLTELVNGKGFSFISLYTIGLLLCRLVYVNTLRKYYENKCEVN